MYDFCRLPWSSFYRAGGSLTSCTAMTGARPQLPGQLWAPSALSGTCPSPKMGCAYQRMCPYSFCPGKFFQATVQWLCSSLRAWQEALRLTTLSSGPDCHHTAGQKPCMLFTGLLDCGSPV